MVRGTGVGVRSWATSWGPVAQVRDWAQQWRWCREVIALHIFSEVETTAFKGGLDVGVRETEVKGDAKTFGLSASGSGTVRQRWRDLLP